MYGNFDEEVFAAPESIVAGVVSIAAFDHEPELPDVAPFRRYWGDAAAVDDADALDVAPHVDESGSVRGARMHVDAWARHARGANGFGG